MLSWKKISAGEYESSEGRFYITKSWDRIYGDHWTVRDTLEPDFYKGLEHEPTLKDCKFHAELIISAEQKSTSGEEK